VKTIYNRSNPSEDGNRPAVQVSAPASRRGYQFDRLQIRIQVWLRYGYQTFQMRLLGFLDNINKQYRQNAGGLRWTNFHPNNTVKMKSIELFSGAKRYGKRKQYYHTLTRTIRSQTGCIAISFDNPPAPRLGGNGILEYWVKIRNRFMYVGGSLWIWILVKYNRHVDAGIYIGAFRIIIELFGVKLTLT
jgi:hypothetical protein